jgi:hypothetical protein
MDDDDIYCGRKEEPTQDVVDFYNDARAGRWETPWLPHDVIDYDSEEEENYAYEDYLREREEYMQFEMELHEMKPRNNKLLVHDQLELLFPRIEEENDGPEQEEASGYDLGAERPSDDEDDFNNE